MAIRDIVIYPDHRLRSPTRPVESLKDIDNLITDLTDTMYYHEAVGIAAIQIGRPEQVFLIDPLRACEERKEEFPDPIVFVNPKIVSETGDPVIMEEGCLSFPGLYVLVRRYPNVKMTATTKAKDGNWGNIELSADGFFARALQHEYDHLSGRLLIDMVSFIKKKHINKMFR